VKAHDGKEKFSYLIGCIVYTYPVIATERLVELANIIINIPTRLGDIQLFVPGLLTRFPV